MAYKPAGNDHLLAMRQRLGPWESLAHATTLAVYSLVVMEWLFFATKPSFMSVLDGTRKSMVVALAPLPYILAALSCVALCGLLARLWRHAAYRAACLALARIGAALAWATLFVLMLDNFTNTVFGVAILKSSGFWRWAYGALVVLLGGLGYLFTVRVARRLATHNFWRWLGLALPAASLVVLAVVVSRAQSTADDSSLLYAPLERPANVVLISGDGLNARSLSCYGYSRQTTPYLDTLVDSSLFCENAFPNCGHTCGSMAAIITGRLSTHTRVVYPPDILRGVDAYRHLPGLLKKFGYRTLHISGRHYADAYDLNVQNGFDRSTFRERNDFLALGPVSALLGQEASYFVDRISDRIRARLLHVVGRDKLPDAFVEVGGDDAASKDAHDETRFIELQEFLEKTDEPFFAHVHLFSSHGPRFLLTTRVFSKGLSQREPWMPEFYDDAILEFDRKLLRLFATLRVSGKLDNTLVVIHTDHGLAFSNRERVPVVMVFPNHEHVGRIRANVQNVDIPPTILDYLGVDKPAWMDGESILANLDPMRPIFSTKIPSGTARKMKGHWVLDKQKIGPPFYSMGVTTMIVCNRSYTADWQTQKLIIEDVIGHTSPCPEDDLPTAEDAERMIVEHLEKAGYDLSSVALPLARPQPASQP